MINALEKLAFAVDTVLIGTDPDTEGEKISWDIYNLLRPFNSKIKRVEFHEVTKPALLKSNKRIKKHKRKPGKGAGCKEAR